MVPAGWSISQMVHECLLKSAEVDATCVRGDAVWGSVLTGLSASGAAKNHDDPRRSGAVL